MKQCGYKKNIVVDLKSSDIMSNKKKVRYG